MVDAALSITLIFGATDLRHGFPLESFLIHISEKLGCPSYSGVGQASRCLYACPPIGSSIQVVTNGVPKVCLFTCLRVQPTTTLSMAITLTRMIHIFPEQRTGPFTFHNSQGPSPVSIPFLLSKGCSGCWYSHCRTAIKHQLVREQRGCHGKPTATSFPAPT
jgi:hypothetical protein